MRKTKNEEPILGILGEWNIPNSGITYSHIQSFVHLPICLSSYCIHSFLHLFPYWFHS